MTRNGAGALMVMVMSTALLLSSVGCAPEAEDPSRFSMRAIIAITSDPQQGLEGADVMLSAQVLAKTDAGGRAAVTLHGMEGDNVELGIRCPPGYQSPQPLRIALRRLSKGSAPPRFDARCAPSERTVVVGIRVDNGPNLPIQHLGKVVAHTDASGAAHVVLHVKANEQVTFQIDTKSVGGSAAGSTSTPTAAQRKPTLRPESPTLTFVAKDRDDLVILDQKLEVERAIATRAPSRPSGPQRL